MDAAGLLEIVVLVSAALGIALGGVYVGFDTIVMPALRRLATGDGVRAMQEINRAAVRPGFMLLFFGSALFAVGAIVCAAVLGGGAIAVARIVGNALIAAAFVSTVLVNVPANNAIDALDPDATDTPGRWRSLERRWTIANRLRAAAAILGGALVVGAQFSL